MCGENDVDEAATAVQTGSSPRVRGKPGAVAGVERPRRLIPACAGKTLGTVRTGRPTSAHPRVCGENSRGRSGRCSSGGSSPRVRGKPSRAPDRPGTLRLIPACAGKTWRAHAPAPPTRAHPRVCGENGHDRTGRHDCPGSSPRVRGKRGPRRCPARGVRLIPACAGKTGRCPPRA